MTSGCALLMLASGSAVAQGIYTCVDGKGRKLTSDRPIAECMDRTQQEISATSGAVRRIIQPQMTAAERTAAEEKEKAGAEVRAQAAEEKKRERALLQRYPNKLAHDKERSLALVQVEEALKAATKRSQELTEQRKAINADMEFYSKDPGRAPPSLRRRVDENEMSIASQKRVIADQESEKKRVNARFDEELGRLRPLWAAANVPAAAAAGKY
ncbi:MAG: DUF4124 domain-containing protein [Pseudomonadota bacterium]